MINDFNEALRFEEKSNIFFIQNTDGIYLWDIFRYFVWDKLRYESQPTSINLIKNHKVRNLLRIITSINEILKSFFFFCLNLDLRAIYIDGSAGCNLFNCYKFIFGGN